MKNEIGINVINQEELRDATGSVELAFTDCDTLVEAIDGLIQDEVLPESYLSQLHTSILRFRKDDYDIEPVGSKGLENKMHVRSQIKNSFLLFSLRVILHELLQNLRRDNLKDMASRLYPLLKELEKISGMFDNTYRAELGVAQSPAMNSSFWEGRESHPVEAARALIAEASL